MANVEGAPARAGERGFSYPEIKSVVQQHIRRLLAADHDAARVLAEMSEHVRGITAAGEPAAEPVEMRRLLELHLEPLGRFGGEVRVEGVPAPPPLDGGIVRLDDPQRGWMSLLSAWLDCIVANPEQSLASLRRVFLRATDPVGVELNRVFGIDLGRMQPIANPEAWEHDLLRQEETAGLCLDRVTNIVQALGLETPKPMSEVPFALWRHLLRTRPVYDLSAHFTRAGRDTARARVIALRRETEPQSPACLYRVGLTPMPSLPTVPPSMGIEDLAAALGCATSTPVHLELIERAEHLRGSAPTAFSVFLPLEAVASTFSLILNRPPRVLVQDITSTRAPSPRLLRVASSADPERQVRLFRVQMLPRRDWPARQGFLQVYRFRDLGDLGVTACPPGGYLQVSLGDTSKGDSAAAELYFHRWGERRVSFHITGLGLRRAAESGSLILLHSDHETALEVLAAMQGLLGPAGPEVTPQVSILDCQVNWRPYPGV